MTHHTHPQPKDRKLREVDRERVHRTRGHLGSRPRGNPEIDHADYERSLDRLARVLGR